MSFATCLQAGVKDLYCIHCLKIAKQALQMLEDNRQRDRSTVVMTSPMYSLKSFDAFLQAGAKHVYGIERSAIAEQARQIIEDNKYQDRITIIQRKVEEVELPVPQVRFMRASVLDHVLCHHKHGRNFMGAG